MKLTRLIQSGYCDCATNMATDEMLFLNYKENISIPTLRIYGWGPASISIGSSQNPEKVLNLENCKKENISFIRRPTGGGVILHDNELTYSIILAQSDIAISSGIKESFKKITYFLIQTYQALGAKASFAKDASVNEFLGHTIADVCFSRKEEYDILIHGKKLGGNAQRRRKNIILQHGSIPFSFDKNRLKTFLKDPSVLDNSSTTSIHEITNKDMDFTTLSKQLITSFKEYFKTSVIDSSLTPPEHDMVEKLKKEKYNTKEWNYSRCTPTRCTTGEMASEL